MGETWRESCNKCYCGNKGVPLCTHWLCVGPPENTITSFHDDFCTPFSRWKDECNVCFCTAEGMPKCTDYNCGPRKINRLKRESRAKRRYRFSEGTYSCQPGFSWHDGCNSHGCTEAGIPYSTLKYCPPEEINRNVKMCREGASWRLQGRMCHCTEKGVGVCDPYRKRREVSSYNRPKTVERNMYEKACQPGYIWDDGCNSFACTDDGYFASSLNVCPEEKIDHDVRMCAKGSTWNFGNWKCRCTDQGFGKCIQSGNKKRTRLRNQKQDIR